MTVCYAQRVKAPSLAASGSAIVGPVTAGSLVAAIRVASRRGRGSGAEVYVWPQFPMACRRLSVMLMPLPATMAK